MRRITESAVLIWAPPAQTGEAQNCAFHEAPLDKAASLTHQHILAVINTELARRGVDRSATFRVLDIGCGDGLLLRYLAMSLPACWPGATFEFFGFDVDDHGVQQPGYFAGTIALLGRDAPGRPWRDRLALISERQSWPYEAGHFDILVSNQVIEHVTDPGFFFSEMTRVLRPDGFAVHMFPLGHTMFEPHLRVPFAHWFSSADAIARCIRIFSALGIGKFESSGPDRSARLRDLDSYVRRHTDYLIRFTNYLTQLEISRHAKRSKLHGSFRYTSRYYRAKLRQLLGKAGAIIYRAPAGALAAVLTFPLRYVASVTLLLEKDESYSSSSDLEEEEAS